MKISELFSKAGIEYPKEFGGIEIQSIVTDSRRVTPGAMFLCIRGRHTDGHAHIREAIKAGATVVVAEQMRLACVGGAAATIYVDNTRRACALFFGRRQIKISSPFCKKAPTTLTLFLRILLFPFCNGP